MMARYFTRARNLFYCYQSSPCFFFFFFTLDFFVSFAVKQEYPDKRNQVLCQHSVMEDGATYCQFAEGLKTIFCYISF